jgi:phosphatidylglycerophosphatase C
MSDAAPVVVFDFDLTLTRWDTADRFFRWLLRRNVWRLALVLAATPILGLLFLSRRTRKWLIRYAVWIATVGRSRDALEALVREHVDAFLGAGERVFLPAGLERLKSHLEAGHVVVIATGTLEPLARELLRRESLEEVPLVASTLRPFLGGMARDRHCFGRNKLTMLSERGFAPPYAVAYSDHHCDLPVLQSSRQCWLVSPKAGCIVKIGQALSTPPGILSWR